MNDTGEHDGLEAWLAENGYPAAEIVPLSGDLSPRRYARVRRADGRLKGRLKGDTAILAIYPAEIRATASRFAATTSLLAGIGVRVPAILAVRTPETNGGGAPDEDAMLLEDLGSQTLAEWALASGTPWSELRLYFRDALAQARRIATLPPGEVEPLSPVLGRELLEKELRQTWDLFLVPRGLLGDAGDEAALAGVLAELCARLAEDPPVPCHRDYMARNLMPLGASGERPSVAVLDHQDLRLGPPAYDLASLLNDTLFPPPEIEAELLAEAAPTPAERLRYHRAAAQRTLKAVGTFAAFARRGAPRHLPLIPPTLERCLAHLAALPESRELAPRLAQLWSRERTGQAPLETC
jgi:N-acetylmuramate 1-kinase